MNEHEENLTERQTFEDRPGMLDLFGYGSLILLGTASLLNECIYSYFAFVTGRKALEEGGKTFFHQNIPDEITFITAGTFSVLNLMVDLSSVSPVQDVRKLMGIVKKDKELVFIQKKTKKLGNGFRSIIKVIPLSIFLLSTTSGSFANVLVIDDNFHGRPINWALSATSLIVSVSYYALLSYQDFLDGIEKFRHIKNSEIGLLFKKSFVIGMLPLSKILIATINYDIVFGYYAFTLAKQVLALDNEISSIFLAVAVGSTSFMVFFTRGFRAFQTYLEPFQSDSGYDFHLLSDSQNMGGLSIGDYCLFSLKSLPLALVRGGLGYLVYKSIQSAELNIFRDETLDVIMPIAFGGITGALLFFHPFLVECLWYYPNQKRRALLEQQPGGSSNNSSKYTFLVNALSTLFSGASQVAKGLINVYSVIILFSDWIGETNAAILGLLLASERAWTNFFYYQDKLAKNFSERGSNIYSFFSGKCGRRARYEEIDNVNEACLERKEPSALFGSLLNTQNATESTIDYFNNVQEDKAFYDSGFSDSSEEGMKCSCVIL